MGLFVIIQVIPPRFFFWSSTRRRYAAKCSIAHYNIFGSRVVLLLHTHTKTQKINTTKTPNRRQNTIFVKSTQGKVRTRPPKSITKNAKRIKQKRQHSTRIPLYVAGWTLSSYKCPRGRGDSEHTPPLYYYSRTFSAWWCVPIMLRSTRNPSPSFDGRNDHEVHWAPTQTQLTHMVYTKYTQAEIQTEILQKLPLPFPPTISTLSERATGTTRGYFAFSTFPDFSISHTVFHTTLIYKSWILQVARQHIENERREKTPLIQFSSADRSLLAHAQQIRLPTPWQLLVLRKY